MTMWDSNSHRVLYPFAEARRGDCIQGRHSRVRGMVVAWRRLILGAKVEQAHCQVESRWPMVKGERRSYEKCPINRKTPFLTAMDSRTGTRLVRGCERRELYGAGTAVGTMPCVLAATADELGDPCMKGRRLECNEGRVLSI